MYVYDVYDFYLCDIYIYICVIYIYIYMIYVCVRVNTKTGKIISAPPRRRPPELEPLRSLRGVIRGIPNSEPIRRGLESLVTSKRLGFLVVHSGTWQWTIHTLYLYIYTFDIWWENYPVDIYIHCLRGYIHCSDSSTMFHPGNRRHGGTAVNERRCWKTQDLAAKTVHKRYDMVWWYRWDSYLPNSFCMFSF